MLFKIASYIQFLFQSSNKHDVHSPFVFKFYTECLLKKPPKKNISKIKSIRKVLFNDHSIIDVKDFGQGSKVFKNNTRKVSKIAKVAGISLKKSLLLMRIIDVYKPKKILELGTSLGLATSCMGITNWKSYIDTIEGCPNTANIATSLFNKFELSNINLVVKSFDMAISSSALQKNYDLVYFDGNHNKLATLKYFEHCLSITNDNSILIFDDIYWSSEMKEAWQEIIAHPKVTVSINSFFWGIVFFKKSLSKEHFTLRC